ncbi:MAG: hypothetical protein AB7F79_02190 [Steroidobacteraceae bacterium]
MKIKHLSTSLLLLQAVTIPAVMASEGFEISPRIGKTTLRIDADQLKSNTLREVDALQTGVRLAYVTPIGFMTEAGYSTQGNWSWFGTVDKYRLTEYSLAVGYQFETEHGFRIVPKVGRTRWDLFSKESTLLNPDTDRQNTIRDYDYFWELTLQKKISDSVALGVSYKDNSYKFGNVRSIAFTASFGL